LEAETKPIIKKVEIDSLVSVLKNVKRKDKKPKRSIPTKNRTVYHKHILTEEVTSEDSEGSDSLSHEI